MASVQRPLSRPKRSSEKMPRKPIPKSPKSRVSPPMLQSLRSLPVDYKFGGLPGSCPIEKPDGPNADKKKIASSDLPEYDAFVSEDAQDFVSSDGNMDQVDDDSPYSKKTVSVEEEKPPEGDEVSDLMASRLPVFMPSPIEGKWSDTTSYGPPKKVFCGISHFTFALGKDYCLNFISAPYRI